MIGGLLAGVAAVVLAWIASNVIDIAPQPRPVALQLPAAELADVDNVYGDLSQLLAGGGAAVRLQGPPYVCPGEIDCPDHWLAQGAALREQLRSVAELGRRCEALPAQPRFEERLPASWLPNAAIAEHLLGFNRCVGWWQASAVASAIEGDHDESLRALQRSDGLIRAVWIGSRSLIGVQIAGTQARRQWLALAAIVRKDPTLAQALMRLAEPLPLVAPGRWIPAEASYQHELIRSMMAGSCRGADSSLEDLPAPFQRVLDWVLCHTELGVMPNQTAADIDHYWLEAQAAFGTSAQAGKPPQDLDASSLYWRNTFARWTLGSSKPAYLHYRSREADVDLHRQALQLALQLTAQRIPPAERRVWLQAHAGPAADRLTIDDEGLVLRARRHDDADPRKPIAIRLVGSP